MQTFLAGVAVGVVLATGAVSLLQGDRGTAVTGRVPQFENAAVKVWKTTVAPGSPTALHRHDHGRVVVALNGGTMDLIDSSGKHEPHVWEAGHAYWLPAMAAGAMHRDVNAGEKPLEVVVVELEKE